MLTPGIGKRGRASGVNDDEGVTFEWRWGARSHAEVGEQAIAQFVAEFMAERMLRNEDEDEEDDDARRAAANQKKGERLVTSVLKDITRAAGGQLRDLTATAR